MVTLSLRTALRCRRTRVATAAAVVALAAAVACAHAGIGQGHMGTDHMGDVVAMCLAVAAGAVVVASVPTSFPQPLPRAPRLIWALDWLLVEVDPVPPGAGARASPARLQVFRL